MTTMSDCADIEAALRRAVENSATGKAAFLESRAALNRVREAFVLASANVARGNRDAARKYFAEMASALALIGERQADASAAFTRSRRGIEAALEQLKGKAGP